MVGVDLGAQLVVGLVARTGRKSHFPRPTLVRPAFTAVPGPTAHGCRWVDVRRTAHCRPRRENAFIVFFERVPDPNGA